MTHARIALLLIGLLPLAAQELDIPGERQWTDTGIDVAAGETLRITATGTLTYAGRQTGPQGFPRTFTDLLRALPVNEAGRAALVGRIGDRDSARPFLVGARREMKAAIAGRLFLGVNQLDTERAEGAFRVTLERTPPAPGTEASRATPPANITPFPQKLLDSIAPRVVDDQGTEGDRVNFIVIGSENKVVAALESAGWVKVDRTVKDALLRGVFASMSRQAYITLPMSLLQIFGRPQDYGWAQGDPVRVVAARHHFRIWRAPFEHEGRTVWVGAGTHDVGFDRDQRNNKITHRIDPEVDKERDYIGRSFQESGAVAKLDYMTPARTVREAKTAHGQPFRSDGRTLIIYLNPETDNLAKAFGDLFCSVLKQRNPDTGDWGACSQYLEGGGRDDQELDALASNFRVLVVPGIFSSCASDAPAFAEGREALRQNHGIEAELLQVSNGSSEDNARRIAEYVREKSKDDPRKFILVGYSKGTPDIQVALAREQGLAQAVAAFISVAGASGGSPIADALPSQADRWMREFQMGKCQGDLSAGFKSLSKRVRQEFLAAHPNPVVPTYSLAAVSDRSNTSKSLLRAWELMSVFGSPHDAQLNRADALIPGGKILGAALADHFAVALPFDKSPDQMIRSLADRGRYPRAALLEALVRFVVADLPR